MTDIHSKATRSYNMSRVRAKNTKPELLVRKFLFSQGFRFRLHDKRYPGKPDIILPKYKTVIFINGCFWHGHENCRYFTIPNTNKEWWQKKIETNVKSDKASTEQLSIMGWNVLTIWGCDLRPKLIVETMKDLLAKLHQVTIK